MVRKVVRSRVSAEYHPSRTSISRVSAMGRPEMVGLVEGSSGCKEELSVGSGGQAGAAGCGSWIKVGRKKAIWVG